MAPPQACPDESALRDFLQDRLAGADAERIDDHIGGCPACQRALDRLVGSLPGPWLPEADGAEGDAPVTHVASTSLGVIPRVLVSAIEPGGPDWPVARTGSLGMTARADGPARLHLFGEIARGGMGAILKGRDLALGRDLAVKILLNHHRNDPGLIRRFVMEARIAGQLQHPGTVPVHELGALADGRPYFAMKLVKGRTLAALLKERTDPSANLPRFLGIFEQTCQTVAYAHARGIIHRDLKPANVMVGSFGEVQLMDWGLAKVLTGADGAGAEEEGGDVALDDARDDGGELTDAGSVLGTWPYMPPEQARGLVAEVDRRSDVFGLGAVLCEILTGRPPHIGPDWLSVRRQALEGRLDEVSARLEGCGADAELIRLARRCLAPDRFDRPADGGEVAAAVSAYLSGVQERLQQERLARERQEVRAAEGRRRHRILAAATLSVLLTLATGVVASTIFALGQRAARQKAAEEAIRAMRSEQAALQAAVSEKTARDDAAEQLRQAKRSEARANAVLKFFQDKVLRAARPKGQEGGLSRDVTVREALDRAEPEIDTAFAGEPLVEASIRSTLGVSYQYLGDHEKALAQHKRAIALRRQELGPGHAETAAGMDGLAIILLQTGKSAEAQKILEEVVAVQRRTLGPEDRRTLHAMTNLSIALAMQGLLEDAAKLVEEYREIQRRVEGPESIFTLRSTYNLATMRRHLGQWAESRPLFDESLQTLRRVFGPDHQDTLRAVNGLGELLLDQRRPAEARALFEEVRKGMVQILGPTNEETILSLINVADAARLQGRLDEARRMAEEADALDRRILGPEHPQRLFGLTILSTIARDQDRLDDARKGYDEALAALRRTFSARMPEVQRCMADDAWMLAAAPDPAHRDPRRAIELVNELIRNTPKVRDVWTTLGVAHYRAGSWDDAIAALEKSEAVAPGCFTTVDCFFLAMACWQLGEKEKGREWYAKALSSVATASQPTRRELALFRSEASHLLGIPDPKRPSKGDD